MYKIIEKRLQDLENNQKVNNNNKENEINKISLLEKQFNVIQNQFQSIFDSVNSLTKRLDKLESDVNFNQTISKDNDIKTAINTVTVLNKSIPNIKTKFENRIIQMNKRITILEKPSNELEKKIKIIEEKVNNIENEIKNTKPIQSFTSTLIMSQRSDFITDQDLSTDTTLSQSIY